MTDKNLKEAVQAIANVNGINQSGELKLLEDVDKFIDLWFEKYYNAFSGDNYCPKHNDQVLPDENGNCSLCGLHKAA